MRFFYLINIVLIVFVADDLKANAWLEKQSLSLGRTTAAGFSINGKGYICGGASGTIDLKDLWQFDPILNTWSQKADMPGDGRRELSSFAIDSFGYIGHGRTAATGEIYYSFYKYNPASNTWTTIANCPVQRYTSTGFSLSGMGYVTCGILPGVARYKDLYQYNPTNNTWSEKASLPDNALNRSYTCVVSSNNKAYLSGGYEGAYMNDFYEYDPTLDVWTEKQSFPGSKRSNMIGFNIGKYIVMGLGRDLNGASCQDIYQYNTQNNTWMLSMDIFPGTNTFGLASLTINKKGYVFGGSDINSVIYKKVYEYSAPDLLDMREVEKQRNKPFAILNSSIDQSIKISSKNDGEFIFNLYDLNGKLIHNKVVDSKEEISYSFPTESLLTGIYLVQLIQGLETQYEKVIIN